jgi:SAM-dependent methyltransferase
LSWTADDARCSACGVGYPVHAEIPILVAPGSDARDLWEEAESALSAALRDDPHLEGALLGASLHQLAPADAFLRALVLEERGEADGAVATAFRRLYTPAALACQEEQLATMSQLVGSEDGLVIDVATGRGMLLDRLRPEGAVATDISPRVLRRARGRGFAAVACDAERLPFADASIATVTTYLGLGNVARPVSVLRELRRVAARLVVGHVVYERGTANDAAVTELGLTRVAYRDVLLDELSAAGWGAWVVADHRGRADPTPKGVLLAGAVVDALPVEPVDAAWLVIEAR